MYIEQQKVYYIQVHHESVTIPEAYASVTAFFFKNYIAKHYTHSH